MSIFIHLSSERSIAAPPPVNHIPSFHLESRWESVLEYIHKLAAFVKGPLWITQPNLWLLGVTASIVLILLCVASPNLLVFYGLCEMARMMAVLTFGFIGWLVRTAAESHLRTELEGPMQFCLRLSFLCLLLGFSALLQTTALLDQTAFHLPWDGLLEVASKYIESFGFVFILTSLTVARIKWWPHLVSAVLVTSTVLAVVLVTCSPRQNISESLFFRWLSATLCSAAWLCGCSLLCLCRKAWPRMELFYLSAYIGLNIASVLFYFGADTPSSSWLLVVASACRLLAMLALFQCLLKCLLHALQDIQSENEQQSNLLKQENARLSLDAKAKDLFFSTMSHEIRTPLAGLTGLLDLLAATHLTEEQQQHVGTMQMAAENLLCVVNDVLDMAKLECGKLVLENIPFVLGDTIDGCMRLFSSRFQEKGLRADIQFESTVPKIVVGDPTRLRQILMNLLSNAVKFTQAGSISIKVHMIQNQPTSVILGLNPNDSILSSPDGAARRSSCCSNVRFSDLPVCGTVASANDLPLRMSVSSAHAEDHGPYICFEVQDTGCGMTSIQQRRLFAPFAQGDVSVARTHGGTGLGLCIVGKLVSLMNGTIDVKSSPNHGTTFSVCLPLPAVPDNIAILPTKLMQMLQPLLPGAPDPTSPLKCAIPQTGSETPLNNVVVLICDDNDINRCMLQKMVQAIGCRVLTASNGRQAVDFFTKPTPSNTGSPRRSSDGTDGIMPFTSSAGTSINLLMSTSSTLIKASPSLPSNTPGYGPTSPVEVGENVIDPDVVAMAAAMASVVGSRELPIDPERPSVDIIFMDIWMPELDGIQATHIIHGLQPSLPIVGLTADIQRSVADAAHAAGMCDLVMKPVRQAVLRATIEKYVPNAAQRRPSSESQLIVPEQGSVQLMNLMDDQLHESVLTTPRHTSTDTASVVSPSSLASPQASQSLLIHRSVTAPCAVNSMGNPLRPLLFPLEHPPKPIENGSASTLPADSC